MSVVRADIERRRALITREGQQSLALFGQSLEDWQSEPELAFDHWLANAGLNANSARVYRALWRQYLTWLAVHRLALTEVDTAHIAEFLKSLGERVKRPQRERYHRLLERVYDAMFRPTPPDSYRPALNPASLAATPQWNEWRVAQHNEPTHFLSAKSQQLLAEHLNQMDEVLPGPQAPESFFLTRSGGATKLWRAWRNRALYAVFLGAGLKLYQAIGLTIQDVQMRRAGAEYVLSLRTPGARHPHHTYLQGQMAQWFSAWLQVRAKTIATSRVRAVFLASANGQALSKSAAQRALVTVLDSDSWVVASRRPEGLCRWPGGLEDFPTQIDAQGLRNSCAANWFEAGESISLVAERLGYADVVCAWRLYDAWLAMKTKSQEAESRDRQDYTF